MANEIDMVQDVIDFHYALGAGEHVASVPSVPSAAVVELKSSFIQEEYEELEEAIWAKDLVGVADACADLIYVTIGLALAYGIDLRPVWREVQRSNMAKLGGPRRADGKHLKPEGWRPPDVAGVLAQQQPL